MRPALSVRLSAFGLLTAVLLGSAVEGRQATALHNLLSRTASEFPGKAGIYVKHLTTGETAGVRDGEVFNSASVIKIPVLVIAFQMVDKGALKLDERTRPIPVFVVSARPGHEVVERALAAGAEAFIRKPFENAEMVERIRARLDR